MAADHPDIGDVQPSIVDPLPVLGASVYAEPDLGSRRGEVVHVNDLIVDVDFRDWIERFHADAIHVHFVQCTLILVPDGPGEMVEDFRFKGSP